MPKVRKKKATIRPSTEARRSVLREALLDAAERVVTERGLAGLNARELAGDVGCALGAIYNVFPDLDAIVYAVNARTLTAIDKTIVAREARTEGEAIADLVGLARAYLRFATVNQSRWRALFEHLRWAPDAAPDWYAADLRRLFGLVEGPLAVLRPDLSDAERQVLARTMFSAVHGVISLGLEERLVSVPVAKLDRQIGELVTAIAAGLAAASRPPRRKRKG